MNELKPCPFCGDKNIRMVYWDEEEQNEKAIENIEEEQNENLYPVIRCYGCDIEFFGGIPIKIPELKAMWNRRTENG